MRLVLRRLAKRDIAEARQWYDERRLGLGKDFLVSVEATLAMIRDHPRMFPRVHPLVRRAKMERFPFGIFYTIDGEVIRVLAVLHHARSPEQWKRRLEETRS